MTNLKIKLAKTIFIKLQAFVAKEHNYYWIHYWIKGNKMPHKCDKHKKIHKNNIITFLSGILLSTKYELFLNIKSTTSKIYIFLRK